MDYDALKDQWSEVEDRDGIRLSWNTFPSSRMVSRECSSLLERVGLHFAYRKPRGLLFPSALSTHP